MAALFRCSKDRKVRDSVYSVVSSSEVTPGSLDIWIDLPEDIRHDPSLAPFRRHYEQKHGKLENVLNENNKNFIIKNSTEAIKEKKLNNLDEDDSSKTDNEEEESPNHGNRVIDAITENEDKKKCMRIAQLMKVYRIIKTSSLLACWALLTVALILNKENKEIALHTVVTNGEIKEYNLTWPESNRLVVQVTVTGPFQPDERGTSVGPHLNLWLYASAQSEEGGFEEKSKTWPVRLQSEEKLDFAPSVSLARTLSLDLSNYATNDTNNNKYIRNDTNITLRLSTVGNKSIPLTISCHINPVLESQGILYSALLLIFLYVLIIFEVVNRTIAALLSSTLAVAVLALCGIRPTLPELVSWLDVETLLLLLSMMLLVSMLAETGLFDYLALAAFELTGGRTWPLITCLCLFTGLSSTVLDNVTTVLLVTPVTIRLCEVMNLNPIPVLMSMVVFSNVGGAATPVGDPPNVIIASHPSLLAEGINFTTFTAHMGLGILLVSIQTYIQLRIMFRHRNSLRHSQPSHILEMQQEIAAWRRAAASLTSFSKDEDIVKRALEKKVRKLKSALRKREAKGEGGKSDPKFCSTLAQMKEKHSIRDKELLLKCVISVTFVVVVFFLHAIPQLQALSLGWTALLGALLLLILAEREDLEPILARVEWSTLLFFAALFVFMEALTKLGLISWIGSLVESVILQVDEKSRLAAAIMLVLWVSGLASAFVDNIPLTTMMVRVMAAMGGAGGLGLPLAPLAWALSFGACLGGNGTLIGASANVVCAGVAEQHGYKFTFMQYLKIGFPVMIGNLIVASLYLLLCHCVFEWH